MFISQVLIANDGEDGGDMTGEDDKKDDGSHVADKVKTAVSYI